MPLCYPLQEPSIIRTELTVSTLDLLQQPYVYSQSSLLSVPQFIKAARKRGFALKRGQLEQLHFRGVLVPFYRIHQRQIAVPKDRSPPQQTPTAAWQLYGASSEGRLSDPALRPFKRWPKAQSTPCLYYSRYQLLSLRALRSVLTQMKHHVNDDRVAWELNRLPSGERMVHVRNRVLAIVLETLSARYRPRVLQVMSSPQDDLNRFVNDHDPTEEEQFLSFNDDDLVRRAGFLLSNARSFDPLGSWYRVVRIANRRRWDELRNDALIAQEQRVAAEIILQYIEDLSDRGRAHSVPPLSKQWREPRHDRILVDERQRAETIMDFDLSDRPAVYLAVEGQTEVTIVSKLLELAGLERLVPWISIVDLQGVGGDINLLARVVAVPRLDPDGYLGARVVSPLTALLVVTDPEGKYKTQARRNKAEAGMIDQVLASLPLQLRTDAMKRDLGHLIHLRNWNEEFEYAHFSNTELAKAIRAVVGPTCSSFVELRKDVQAARGSRRPLKSVWKDWTPKPSKVLLAEALWPHLRNRIVNPRSRRAIPVVDIVEEAITISHKVHRAREMAVDQNN